MLGVAAEVVGGVPEMGFELFNVGAVRHGVFPLND